MRAYHNFRHWCCDLPVQAIVLAVHNSCLLTLGVIQSGPLHLKLHPPLHPLAEEGLEPRTLMNLIEGVPGVEGEGESVGLEPPGVEGGVGLAGEVGLYAEVEEEAFDDQFPLLLRSDVESHLHTKMLNQQAKF